MYKFFCEMTLQFSTFVVCILCVPIEVVSLSPFVLGYITNVG